MEHSVCINFFALERYLFFYRFYIFFFLINLIFGFMFA